ncbi:esterase-like activity of phytase family protein [Taylorella asinigenitalis]|uniref:esterase-like activity of phytase family protein n=1 Tax=Taylorella asinigenitalis TaxID=84590 RepID=UPI00048DF794|nr:esterase-like activity of phytase family protein [Taylorella asinigenitalis]
MPNTILKTLIASIAFIGATGEKAVSPEGKELGVDEYGIDTEGLVVLEDGSFWVSDEYGPHIAKFNAEGVQQERISPLGFKNEGRKLPAVFATRFSERA